MEDLVEDLVRQIGRCVAVLLVLTAGPPAWGAAPAEGFLIVPGQSLGPLRLGVTVAALYQTPGWGQPDRTHTAGSVIYMYYARHGVAAVVRENAVVMLLTTSERYRTDRGVGVGQAAAAATAAYGQGDAGGDDRMLWYDAMGLLVIIGGNTIIRVGVFDPKTLVRLILAEERPARDVFLTARQAAATEPKAPGPATVKGDTVQRTVVVTVTLKNTSRMTKVLNPNFFTLVDRRGKAYRYDPSTIRQANACRSTIAVRPGESASCSLVFVLTGPEPPRSIAFNDGASVDEVYL